MVKKNTPNYSALIFIPIILVLTFGCIFFASEGDITNLFDTTERNNSTSTSTTEIYFTDTGDVYQFTDVMFVSTLGDNSDGSSWDNAYNLLTTALDESSSNANYFTLIMLGSGEQDINRANSSFPCNVFIAGDDRPSTSIVNTHVNASYVLQMTGNAVFNGIIIDCGTNNSGIEFTGGVAKMQNCIVQAPYADTNLTLVHFNGTPSSNIDEVDFVGDFGKTYTTALKLTNAFLSRARRGGCWFGLIGLHLENVNYMVFNEMSYSQTGTAIYIDENCSNTFFEITNFRDNTHNINDTSGTAFFAQETTNLEKEILSLYPETISGAVIDGHADPNTYGDWVNITTNTTFSKPFKIMSGHIQETNDVNAIYKIQLAYQNGDIIIITEYIFHGDLKASVASNIFSGIFSSGSIISARIQTDNGGTDDVEVHIGVVLI